MGDWLVRYRRGLELERDEDERTSESIPSQVIGVPDGAVFKKRSQFCPACPIVTSSVLFAVVFPLLGICRVTEGEFEEARHRRHYYGTRQHSEG